MGTMTGKEEKWQGITGIDRLLGIEVMSNGLNLCQKERELLLL